MLSAGIKPRDTILPEAGLFRDARKSRGGLVESAAKLMKNLQMGAPRRAARRIERWSNIHVIQTLRAGLPPGHEACLKTGHTSRRKGGGPSSQNGPPTEIICLISLEQNPLSPIAGAKPRPTPANHKKRTSPTPVPGWACSCFPLVCARVARQRGMRPRRFGGMALRSLGGGEQA